MRKLQKMASLPILVAIMIAQGIDVPPDVPREEAQEIVRLVQQIDGHEGETE